MERNKITSITVFHHYFDKGDILSSLGQVQAMTDENRGLRGHVSEVVEHGGAFVGVHLGDDDDDGVHLGCARDDDLDDEDGVEDGGTIFQY